MVWRASDPDAQVASVAEESSSTAPEDPASIAALDPPAAPTAAAPDRDVVIANEPDVSRTGEFEAASTQEEVAALPETGEAARPEAERLPIPEVDPADPYQRRAASVGLHPGLSRVLLQRMSPVDYENADIAIRQALKKPDNAVVIWPRQRTPELALFRVHFVLGAAPGCRRYVVTITKDGWTTTALPMENCGSQKTAGVPTK